MKTEILPNGECRKLHKALYNQKRPFSSPSSPSIKAFWEGDLLPPRLRSYPAVWSDRVEGHGRLEAERESRLGFIASNFDQCFQGVEQRSAAKIIYHPDSASDGL